MPDLEKRVEELEETMEALLSQLKEVDSRTGDIQKSLRAVENAIAELKKSK